MLIDDRLPPPSHPGRPIWEPDWNLCAWIVAAVITTAACFSTEGIASFLLLCAALAFSALAVDRAIPRGGSMREYRQ